MSPNEPASPDWLLLTARLQSPSGQVEPKRQALKAAEDELAELTANLNKLRAQLKEVRATLSRIWMESPLAYLDGEPSRVSGWRALEHIWMESPYGPEWRILTEAPRRAPRREP